MSKPRVALLGVGLMGAGMAGRLLSANFPLTIYNRNREKAATFARDGAVVVSSPGEAASTAEIVISMVADDLASRDVWLGENGALGGASSGTVLVECSTVTVGWAQELAAAATRRGCELLLHRSQAQSPMRQRVSWYSWSEVLPRRSTLPGRSCRCSSGDHLSRYKRKWSIDEIDQ